MKNALKIPELIEAGFPQLMREARLAVGLSQQQLASMAGASDATISNLENGYAISRRMGRDIGRALGSLMPGDMLDDFYLRALAIESYCWFRYEINRGNEPAAMKHWERLVSVHGSQYQQYTQMLTGIGRLGEKLLQ